MSTHVILCTAAAMRRRSPSCTTLARHGSTWCAWYAGRCLLPTAEQSWCVQVAALAIDAVLTGRYIAKAPTFGLNLATAAGATIHPRVLPLVVELLLAPLSILMPWLFGHSLNRRILAWRRSEAKIGSG